jgi:threonyl-tRNA synthetase
VVEELAARGVRVRLDDRNERLNYRIREAQVQKVPYMLVVGDKEVEAGTVSVRHRHAGDLGASTPVALADKISRLVASRANVEEPAPTGGVA